MPRRRIGQETFGFDARDTVTALDELRDLIDWSPIEAALEALPVVPRGEAGWPPLALFRALLITVWHDLSDVKLADALDDRASFRRFCGWCKGRTDFPKKCRGRIPQLAVSGDQPGW